MATLNDSPSQDGRAPSLAPFPVPTQVAFVALATALMAVSYLDRQVFAVLSPTVTKELGISDATYGLLAGTFSWAYLIGPPAAGVLLDRVGVRRGLVAAVLLWSTIAGMHALCTGVATLFALRFALGLAEAPSFPGAARLVHQAVPKETSPRAFGFLFTGSSLGAVVAPPLATWMSARFGWRFAFIGTAVVGLAWIPVFVLLSRRAPEVFARGDAEPSAHPRGGSAFRVLREPAMWRGIAAALAASPVAAFVFLWAPKLLVARFGATQADLGRLLWIPPLMFDLGSVAFGDLASRARSRFSGQRAQVVLFGVAALFAMTLALVPFADGTLLAAVLAGLALVGVGGISAINTSTVLSAVPRDLVGVAAGTAAAAQSVAYIVASAIVGRLVGSPRGYDLAVWGLAAWVVPGALLWLAWEPMRRTLRPRSA